MVLVRRQSFNLKVFSELYSELCDSIELINSTFTLHLVFVMTSLLSTDVLAVYGAVREFQSSISRFGFLIIANTTWMCIQYLIKAFMAHAGSSTTNEAERSLVLVTKLIITFQFDLEIKTDLNCLLTQIQVRKKNLENNFFAINWNLILSVRILICLLNKFN